MPDPARPVLALKTGNQNAAPQAAPSAGPDKPTVVGAAMTAATNDGEDVTYLPGSDDPHTVKWRGHEFKANIPKRIMDAGLIEAARGNRFYRVGSESSAPNPNAAPKTAMEYRGYVVDWMKGVETVEDLVRLWAADRVLRQTCEVGADDVSYLGTLIEPKLRALRQREGLSDQDVANIWIRHGVLELPWRA